MFYEVFIPAQHDDEFDVTLHLEANNWMIALKSGLLRCGQSSDVRSVMCDIKENNAIHVTDAFSRRVFKLREIDNLPTREPEQPSVEINTSRSASFTERPDDVSSTIPLQRRGLAPSPDLEPLNSERSAPTTPPSNIDSGLGKTRDDLDDDIEIDIDLEIDPAFQGDLRSASSPTSHPVDSPETSPSPITGTLLESILSPPNKSAPDPVVANARVATEAPNLAEVLSATPVDSKTSDLPNHVNAPSRPEETPRAAPQPLDLADALSANLHDSQPRSLSTSHPEETPRAEPQPLDLADALSANLHNSQPRAHSISHPEETPRAEPQPLDLADALRPSPQRSQDSRPAQDEPLPVSHETPKNHITLKPELIKPLPTPENIDGSSHLTSPQIAAPIAPHEKHTPTANPEDVELKPLGQRDRPSRSQQKPNLKTVLDMEAFSLDDGPVGKPRLSGAAKKLADSGPKRSRGKRAIGHYQRRVKTVAVPRLDLKSNNFIDETRSLSQDLPVIGRPDEIQQISESSVEDIFLEIYSLFDEQMTLERAINFILDLATDAIESESGSVLFTTPDGKNLRFAAARGPKASDVIDLTIPIGEGIVGFCSREGVSLAVSDVHYDPRFFRKISEDLGYPVNNLICAPFEHEGCVYGCIELLNKKTMFSASDLNALTYIGQRMGQFIHQTLT